MPQVAGFFLGAFGAAAGVVVPGSMAAGYAVGASIAASTLGGIALNLLGSVALSALSMALQPTPKASGLRTETTLQGGTTSEAFLLGRSATGGTMVCPPMAHDLPGKTPNAFLTYVIELAGVPGHQLDGLSLNGETVEILPDDPHEDYGQRIGGEYDGRAWVKYYDGTQTTADPMLLATYPAPYVRPWTADMVGHGLCYAILTFRYDRKVWSGWPQCRFVLSSVPVYDPRKDSSVGGDGPQRWGQLDTYAPSNNAAVLAYNVKRGIILPGGEIWGGNIPEADLPLSDWMAEMDRADQLVDDGDGGTEPRYRAGTEVRVNDEPFSVIEELLKGCNGQVSETGGVWSLRLGAPRLPVLFFEDVDIIADEAEDFRPFPPLDQIFNAISATYPDPAQNWESAESELVTNAEWEAEDGNRRLTASLSLPVVPYPAQVQRVTHALIADHRRMRRHVLTLPMEACALEALDVVSWTSEANGYAAKLFEVTEAIRDLRTQLVRVSLREVDPEDYEIPEGIIRPTPPAPGPVRPAAQAVEGWQAEPYTITLDGKPRRAGILARWNADGAEDARGVRVAIRRQGEAGDGVEQPLYPVATGGAAITDGILAGVYDIRAQYDADRPTAWTSWSSVEVPAVGFGLDDLSGELLDWFATMRDWIDEGIPEVHDLAQALAEEAQARVAAVQAVADELADETQTRVAQAQATAEAIATERARILALAQSEAAARDALSQSLQVQLDDLEAGFGEEIVTLADADLALTARIATLEATREDLATEITRIDQARIDGDAALALSLTELEGSLETAEGATRANTAALGALRTRVEESEGQLAINSDAITSLGATLDDARAGVSANAAALDTLTLTVTAQGEAIDIATSALTALEADLGDLESALASKASASAVGALGARVTAAEGAIDAVSSAVTALEAGLGDLEDDLATKASASALGALRTRVSTAEGRISTMASAITDLEAGLGDLEDDLATKASASALGALRTRVSTAEGRLNTVSSAITGLEAGLEDLESDLATRASAGAVNTLTARVRAAEGEIDSLSSAVTSLESGLDSLESNVATRAKTSALNALTTRVSTAEGRITANGNAITRLSADLSDLGDVVATRAGAWALNQLSTEVSQIDGTVTALASALTALEATLDDSTAGTTFRMVARPGPGGYARILMSARYAKGTGFKDAGLFIDVSSNWSTPSRLGVFADQFVVATGNGVETPFIVDGGNVYLKGGVIKLTGATTVDGSFAIRSGWSGQRVEMNKKGMRVFDGNGVARVRIGDLS